MSIRQNKRQVKIKKAAPFGAVVDIIFDWEGIETKKIALALLIVLSIVCIAAPALANVYVGNLRSYKFHYEGCRGERMMAEHNRIYFYSRDEAIDYGMVPCKICNP